MSGGWGTPRMTPEPQEEPAAAVVLPGRPSVGRIVHYVARGSADGVFPAVCRAAIVTEVPRDEAGGLIYLAAITPTGLFFDRDISYDPENGPGTWHWPERV